MVIVTPAEGPSLGTAPAGTCKWKRFPVNDGGVDVQLRGVAAHVGHGDLGRLLHDVAELTGERQALGAFGHTGLDEEYVTPGAGHGESRRHTGHAGAVGRLEVEVRTTEPLSNIAGLNDDGSLALTGR